MTQENTRFDTIIAEQVAAESQAASNEADGADEVEIENATTDDDHDGDEGEQKAAKRQSDEQFPKKAINALSRRDRTIGKQRAQIEQMMARIQEFESKQASQSQGKNSADADAAPKEESFENYGEYLAAVARHEARKEWQGEAAKQQQSNQERELQRYYAEREAAIEIKASEYVESVPDYKQTLMEHADIVDHFPPAIQQLFLDADDGALAFYNLAKGGQLESLMTMPLSKAAFLIGRAETQAPATVKKVSTAPAPIKANNGSSRAGAKSLDEMSSKELKAWLNS